MRTSTAIKAKSDTPISNSSMEGGNLVSLCIPVKLDGYNLVDRV